jgi:hypothetical protein
MEGRSQQRDRRAVAVADEVCGRRAELAEQRGEVVRVAVEEPLVEDRVARRFAEAAAVVGDQSPSAGDLGNPHVPGADGARASVQEHDGRLPPWRFLEMHRRKLQLGYTHRGAPWLRRGRFSG